MGTILTRGVLAEIYILYYAKWRHQDNKSGIVHPLDIHCTHTQDVPDKKRSPIHIYNHIYKRTKRHELEFGMSNDVGAAIY